MCLRPVTVLSISPRTSKVLTSATPLSSALAPAHAPPMDGARVNLAAQCRRTLARLTSLRTKWALTDALVTLIALALVPAPTIGGVRVTQDVLLPSLTLATMTRAPTSMVLTDALRTMSALVLAPAPLGAGARVSQAATVPFCLLKANNVTMTMSAPVSTPTALSTQVTTAIVHL